MRNRLRLVTFAVSAAAHVGLIVGLVFVSLGPLEKVTRAKAQLVFQPPPSRPPPEVKPVVGAPPAPGPGTKREPPKVAKIETPEVVQPPASQPAVTPATLPVGDGDDEKAKDGDKDKGKGKGKGGDGTCLTPPCDGDVVSVDPQTMAAHRVSGDAQIPLPREVKLALHAAHVAHFGVVVDLCLSESGVPTTVRVHRATGYAAAEEKILDAVRGWRYAPYTIDGAPVPVCTKVSFLYEITE